MNVWDIVVGALVLVIVALAVRSMVRTRRQGGCAVCPYAGSCTHKGSSSCTRASSGGSCH